LQFCRPAGAPPALPALLPDTALLCCPAARGPAPAFTTNITNITFYFNTSLGTWADAQLGCNLNGGHIAAYTSQEEQVGSALLYSAGGRGACVTL
jgi:hypothetical protein